MKSQPTTFRLRSAIEECQSLNGDQSKNGANWQLRVANCRSRSYLNAEVGEHLGLGFVHGQQVVAGRAVLGDAGLPSLAAWSPSWQRKQPG